MQQLSLTLALQAKRGRGKEQEAVDGMQRFYVVKLPWLACHLNQPEK